MGNKEKAASSFLQDAYEAHQGKLLVLDSYTNNLTKVNVLCNTCGHIWGITPSNLKSGNTELLTHGINFKKALEQAKVELGITNAD